MDQHRRAWRPLVMGPRAAVASNHPTATAAGAAILCAGGNAVDAAAAVGMALGIAEPHMSGLGGDAFYNVWFAASERGFVYNGCGPAPKVIRAASFASGIPTSGPQATSTPGFLGAMWEMHATHGVLDWRVVCMPAIELADQGVAATHNYRRFAAAQSAKLRADPNSARIFLRGGEPPPVGELIRQQALAETLSRVAEGGAEEFYRGDLSRTLVKDLAEIGNQVSAADLSAFKVTAEQPISINYRGFTVLQTPPNSVGFTLLQQLKIIEFFDLRRFKFDSAELTHILVEAKKLAYLDMERYELEPSSERVSLERLLGADYAAELAAAIDLGRAAVIPLRLPEHSGCTTYFCVIDADGNSVSGIQSLNNPFGSGVMAPITGILLNNRMASWHTELRHPNRIQAGKRVRQTMNAPIIVKDGAVWALFGTPGADSQMQVNLRTAVGLIDYNLDPQSLAEAPRWFSSQSGQDAVWPHHGTNHLIMEEGFPADTIEGLRACGHELRLVPPMEIRPPSSIQCIRVLDNGVRVAGSDPRWDGWAAAM